MGIYHSNFIRNKIDHSIIFKCNKASLLLALFIFLYGLSCSRNTGELIIDEDPIEDSTNPPLKNEDIKIGVYFFDGWSGQNRHANDPNEPWAKNAPTHLTRRMVEEFPEREPIWGWRADSQEIVEQQIDLAADHGINFFLFCWYYKDNKGPINITAIEKDSKHTQMELYLKAANRKKIDFALLIANHTGSEITGAANWEKVTQYWMKYLTHSQYTTVDGKPLIVLFDPNGIDNESMERMQTVAKSKGLKGLSIAGCGNPKANGFTHRTHYNITAGGFSSGISEERSYSILVEANKNQWLGSKKLPYIPIVTVAWDKRPWEGPTGRDAPLGYYYTGRTPEKFKSFLADAVTWMDYNPEHTTKERMILLYAWNENGEGGYLVPTKGDPEGEYLKVIRKVVDDQK